MPTAAGAPRGHADVFVRGGIAFAGAVTAALVVAAATAATAIEAADTVAIAVPASLPRDAQAARAAFA